MAFLFSQKDLHRLLAVLRLGDGRRRTDMEKKISLKRERAAAAAGKKERRSDGRTDRREGSTVWNRTTRPIYKGQIWKLMIAN